MIDGFRQSSYVRTDARIGDLFHNLFCDKRMPVPFLQAVNYFGLVIHMVFHVMQAPCKNKTSSQRSKHC